MVAISYSEHPAISSSEIDLVPFQAFRNLCPEDQGRFWAGGFSRKIIGESDGTAETKDSHSSLASNFS